MHRKNFTKISQDAVGLFRPVFVLVWNIVSCVYIETPPPPKKRLPQAQFFNSLFTDMCTNTERNFPNIVALPWVAGSKVAYLMRLSSPSSLLESLQCDRPFRLGSLELETRAKDKVRVLNACIWIQSFAIFLVSRTFYKSCLLCGPLSRNYLSSQTPKHNSR
jgi:hypothetical protein